MRQLEEILRDLADAPYRAQQAGLEVREANGGGWEAQAAYALGFLEARIERLVCEARAWVRYASTRKEGA